MKSTPHLGPTVEDVVKFTEAQYGFSEPISHKVTGLPDAASRLQTAKEICRQAGFEVIAKGRIQVLQATVSITDDVKYVVDPVYDYMDYAKKDIARNMAYELGASDAITWAIAKDKYLPCTRIGGKLIVVRPP